MVTKIIKVQQDSSNFIFGHYKCPFFNFGEWSWEKIIKVFIYIIDFLT
jgi:phage-related holin